MVYVASAFSLNMLKGDSTLLRVRKISIDEAKAMMESGFVSVVGHESTARVMSELLGVEIVADRSSVELQAGDKVIVFQLLKRLGEGVVLSADGIHKTPHAFYIVEVLE